MELGIAFVGVIIAFAAALFAVSQTRLTKRQLKLSMMDRDKIAKDIVTEYFFAAGDTINAIEELLNILKEFTLPRDFLNSKVRECIGSALGDVIRKLDRSTERYQAAINADLISSGSSIQEVHENMVELVERIQSSLTGWGFWNIISKVYDSAAFDSDFAELVRMYKNMTQNDLK